jgi:autotransporter-associated beta strand protein
VLSCIAAVFVAPAAHAQPTVGDGNYFISVRGAVLAPWVGLAPNENVGPGQLAPLDSGSQHFTLLDLDPTYQQTNPDGSTSNESTFVSVALDCSNTPIASLGMTTSYDNIPLNAAVTVGGNISYNFVAYEKIALTLPYDDRVPLITKGYVDTSLTTPGPGDYAYAESTLTTQDGTTIDITARSGDGAPQVESRLNFPTTNCYVHPDFVNQVTLSVAGSFDTSGSEAGSSGSKGLQAIADPGIYVDPTATLDIDGTTYLATDVFGVAFSPGFQEAAPVPSDLALTSSGTTLTLAGATSKTFANVTLASGTTLDMATNNISVTAASLADANSASTAGEAINLGAAQLTVGGNNANTTFSGNITGTGGSLVKVGSGTLTLTDASNSYTGTTTVNAGTVSVSNDQNLGIGGGIVLNGGALSASATFELNALRGIVVGPATVGTGSGTLDVAPGAILTYNGAISDNSSTTPGAIGALIKTGAGELKLGGTGTYTGGTSVEDGLLVIDSSEAIPSGSTVATTVNGAIVLGDPSLPSDGTSVGGLTPGSGLGSGGGLAASGHLVPEPGTLVLLAAACGFAVLWLRRKGRK